MELVREISLGVIRRVTLEVQTADGEQLLKGTRRLSIRRCRILFEFGVRLIQTAPVFIRETHELDYKQLAPIERV